LAQSIRQSVADWKNLLKQKGEPASQNGPGNDKWVDKSYKEMKEIETPVSDLNGLPKP
jgi:hypothetical protein